MKSPGLEHVLEPAGVLLPPTARVTSRAALDGTRRAQVRGSLFPRPPAPGQQLPEVVSGV